MNRADLTALYLDELKRHGIAARDLIGTEQVLLDAFHGGRYLARPMFLGQDERDQLESDLVNLRAALLSLPDKLYGGDLPAFARSVGMTEVQVSAIMRSRAAAPTTLARADLYVDDTGFRLLSTTWAARSAALTTLTWSAPCCDTRSWRTSPEPTGLVTPTRRASR